MNVLLTHPGTQYARYLAKELYARGALGRFATGITFPDTWFAHGLDRFGFSGWENRRTLVPSRTVSNFPALELTALWKLKHGGSPEEVLHHRNRRFQESIPDKWIQQASHVIGFDTSSWLLATRCLAAGRPFFLDQSIGHPRSKEHVFGALRKNFPDWSHTIPQKDEAHLSCEEAEHAVASIIVVPSNFVKQSLIEYGVSGGKVRVIPFGTNLDLFYPAKECPATSLIFLYVGAITARKGVPVLLDAWNKANVHSKAELWIAGPGELPRSVRRPEGVRFLGALSRTEVPKVMRRSHVFVFPSFFEGLAQVQVEALASGLPVIGTTASGSEDVLIPNETGFTLEAGGVDELADCLKRFAGSSDLMKRMRDRCIETRSLRDWSHYGEKWAELLESYNSQPKSVDPAFQEPDLAKTVM